MYRWNTTTEKQTEIQIVVYDPYIKNSLSRLKTIYIRTL